MRVRVNKPGAAPGTVVGFDGTKRRRQGEEFDFKGKPSLLWMEPVDAAAKKAFAEAGWTPPKEAPATEAAPAEEPEKKGVKKGAAGKGGSGDAEVI